MFYTTKVNQYGKNYSFQHCRHQKQKPDTAVEFESDNLLMKAGGAAAATMAENKLNEQLSKIGIKDGQMSFTFNADSTFTSTVGKKTLKGTYSYNASTKQVDLKYLRLLNLHAKVNCSSNSLELLFNSDKLLKLMAFIGSKSNSTALIIEPQYPQNILQLSK